MRDIWTAATGVAAFQNAEIPQRVLNRKSPADTSHFEKRWFRPPHSKCLNFSRSRHDDGARWIRLKQTLFAGFAKFDSIEFARHWELVLARIRGWLLPLAVGRFVILPHPFATNSGANREIGESRRYTPACGQTADEDRRLGELDGHPITLLRIPAYSAFTLLPRCTVVATSKAPLVR